MARETETESDRVKRTHRHALMMMIYRVKKTLKIIERVYERERERE